MKRISGTYIGSLALASALVAGLALGMGPVTGAGAQAVPPTDPASVLLAFEKTIGADVDAGLAFIADDAVLKITPPPQGTPGVWTGKEQIRQALQYSRDHLVKRDVVGAPQVNGNNVTDTVMTSNDFFQMLGVAPVQFTTQAVIEGGKIKSFVTVIAPSEQGRVGAAIQAYQAAHAAQPAGSAQSSQPAGMPRTGAGQESSLLPAALLAIMGVCLLLAGVVVRRARVPSRKR